MNLLLHIVYQSEDYQNIESTFNAAMKSAPSVDMNLLLLSGRVKIIKMLKAPTMLTCIVARSTLSVDAHLLLLSVRVVQRYHVKLQGLLFNNVDVFDSVDAHLLPLSVQVKIVIKILKAPTMLP